jgi:hypothetical protein
MKQNMGNIDRIARVSVSLVLIGLYFFGVLEGTLGYVALAAAGIFVLTSVVSFCPLYLPLNISTKKDET